jgi:hypothetical protein
MSRPKSEIAADLRQMKESALWIERIENKGNFIEQEFEKFKSAAARLKEDVGGESFSGLFIVDNKCDHQPLIKYLEDRL